MSAAPSPYPDPAKRALITLAALTAVMMTTLDGTIAVIALPRIQSSLAASQEQIAWVLTSYLIASAIATPLAGWLATRFGRVRVMTVSVAAFTLASVGCGLSPNLETLVVFRFIQGFAGASLVPLSQVLLLDINPPERHGPATALFGMGTLVGPMIGPTLGDWLTETASWRAIFLINVPVGVLALLGLILFARDSSRGRPQPFDLMGFLAVSITLAALQLMFDRGQMQDWFSSREIWIEATVAALFAWLALVHMLTAPDPFIKPRLFADRNFLLGSVLGAMVGVFLVGVVPIVTSMMQQLLGYPVILTGILSFPRAVGNVLTLVICGRIINKVDPRWIILVGLLLQNVGLYVLTELSLSVGKETMAVIAFLQGCGSGFLFLPLTLLVFSTLPPTLAQRRLDRVHPDPQPGRRDRHFGDPGDDHPRHGGGAVTPGRACPAGFAAGRLADAGLRSRPARDAGGGDGAGRPPGDDGRLCRYVPRAVPVLAGDGADVPADARRQGGIGDARHAGAYGVTRRRRRIRFSVYAQPLECLDIGMCSENSHEPPPSPRHPACRLAWRRRRRRAGRFARRYDPGPRRQFQEHGQGHEGRDRADEGACARFCRDQDRR
jgi:DHA2 family multidrug resistance protein